MAYEYSKVGPVVCPITGSGCELVRRSGYSSLFGISLPYFGILFYFVVAVLSIILANNFIKKVYLFRILVSFIGFAFGVYLTFIEAFVIKAYCIWCIISFIISVVILFLAILRFKKNEN